MARQTRLSGVSLALLGVAGAAFFWVTDPRLGPPMHRAAQHAVDPQHWLFLLRGSPDNLVDAANQALVSTAIGVAGSVAVFAVGLWLAARRPV